MEGRDAGDSIRWSRAGSVSAVYPVVHVDDDAPALAGLKRALRGLGSRWDVTSLPSPEEAFERVIQMRDAVLLTDWMMPSEDWVTLCHRIREHEKQHTGYAYIILLTGKQEIAHVVQALDAGADDFLSKPYDARELDARIRAGMRIVDLQRKLREANGRLERLAMTDGLTGLYNRRRGDEALAEHLNMVSRGTQDLSVLLLDLNRFKPINDSYGHEAGDRLLVAVADRIRSACRQYDSVIRWGGDEFLILCPHTSESEAQSVAERVGAAVSQGQVEVAPGVMVTPHASVGAASVRLGARCDAADVIAIADRAMYAQKGANSLGDLDRRRRDVER